jgi:hypothetical protein
MDVWVDALEATIIPLRHATAHLKSTRLSVLGISFEYIHIESMSTQAQTVCQITDICESDD